MSPPPCFNCYENPREGEGTGEGGGGSGEKYVELRELGDGGQLSGSIPPISL